MFLTIRYLLLALYSKGDLMGVARKSLIYDNSFDLPSSANQDLLIGLRLLIRTLRNIMKGEYCTSDVTHYIIAIDSNQRNRDTHLKYCRLNGLAPFSEMCTLEDSFNMKNVIGKLRLVVVSFSAFVIVLPFLLGKRRSNYALCMRYAAIIESTRLKLKGSKTKIVYDFAAYFNHSNLAALVFKSQGIEVVKVPSIVPLTAHLSGVIADALMLSTPYQLDEFQYFSQFMRVGRSQQAYPKHAEYLQKYRGQSIPSVLNCIGYYSHASWIRSKEKHVESQFGLPLQEEILVKYLSSFCFRSNLKLLIFTHPRERKIQNRIEVENHYKRLVEPYVEHQIYFDELPSSEIFELAEIGVGTMSSVLFERLLCGFKTLFFTENMKSFPIPNSDIKSICAIDLITLERLLQSALGINERDFFRQKSIATYKYSSDFYSQPDDV